MKATSVPSTPDCDHEQCLLTLSNLSIRTKRSKLRILRAQNHEDAAGDRMAKPRGLNRHQTKSGKEVEEKSWRTARGDQCGGGPRVCMNGVCMNRMGQGMGESEIRFSINSLRILAVCVVFLIMFWLVQGQVGS